MKYKPITTLLLMAPVAAWAAGEPIPEPDALPLLAMGGVVALAVKLMRKR